MTRDNPLVTGGTRCRWSLVSHLVAACVLVAEPCKSSDQLSDTQLNLAHPCILLAFCPAIGETRPSVGLLSVSASGIACFHFMWRQVRVGAVTDCFDVPTGWPVHFSRRGLRASSVCSHGCHMLTNSSRILTFGCHNTTHFINLPKDTPLATLAPEILLQLVVIALVHDAL